MYKHANFVPHTTRIKRFHNDFFSTTTKVLAKVCMFEQRLLVVGIRKYYFNNIDMAGKNIFIAAKFYRYMPIILYDVGINVHASN